jgi:hypothetical protein
MTKRLLVLAALTLFALPAAALGSGTTAASTSCKAQLKAVGAANFYSPAMYKSFGACVSKASHLTAAQRQALLSAEKQCHGEQVAIGAAAFDTKYDTKQQHGKQGTTSNSFGKCVSTRASA